MGTCSRLLRSLSCALLLASSGLATSAHAAAAPASARAVTLRPLSIVRTADLEFGSLIPSAVAGTVTINATTDVRTVTGGVIAVSNPPPGAARFTTVGAASFLALINIPAAITLTRGGGPQTMTVDNITTNGPLLRLFPGSTVFEIRVGGRLNVGANQIPGVYVGSFAVTVTYF